MPIDSPQQEDWDRFQAQKILDCGYVSQSVIERFLFSSHNENHVDLCESLQRAGQLNPEQVQFIRASMLNQKANSDSSFIATVLTPPRSALLSPSSKQNPVPPEAAPSTGTSGATQEKTGTQFERVESLGKGGMGEVFLVKDQRLQREAALKIVNKDLDNLEGIQRFLREAEVTAGLDHPCIPPVYEVGQTPQGEHYMLMKVIRGDTLKERIEDYHKNGCPEKDLRSLLTALTRVAEAVAYSHSQEIIHRDLKPANVMVGAYGEVMVLDWGLARDLSAKAPEVEESNVPVELLKDEGLTLAGAVVGTPGYMAPEQARGETADAQSDVYGLGAMLTYILTKQCPVKGDNVVQLTIAAAMGKIRGPLELRAGVDPELAGLAVVATQESKERRLGSAQEFLEELQSYLSGERLNCYRYNVSERVQRWVQGHPLLLLTLIAAIVTAFLLSEVNSSIEKEAEALQKEALARRTAVEKEKLLDNLELAKQLARNRVDTDKLRDVLTAILKHANEDPYLMLTVGNLYKQAGLEKECEATFQEARKYPKIRARALFELHTIENKRLGRSLFMDTEYLTELSELVSSDVEDSTFSLWVQAVQQRRENRFRECAATCTKIIDEYSKSFALVYFCRAYANMRLGQREEAKKDLLQAIDLAPDFSRAYIKYMRILMYEGKAEEAIEFYKSIPNRFLNKYRFHRTIAQCYLNRKHFAKALFHFEETDRLMKRGDDQFGSVTIWREKPTKAIENTKEQFAEYYYGFGLALMSLGRKQKATEALRKAVAIDFRAEYSLVKLTRLGFATQDRDSIEELLRRLKKYFPENMDIHVFQIDLALGNRQAAEAFQLSKRFLNQHPDSVPALAAHGRVSQARNKLKIALRSFNEALKRNERDFDCRRRRADILIRIRDYRRAMEDLEILHKRAPKDTRLRVQYAFCGAYLGKFSLAITEFTKLIEEDPNNYEAYRGRGQTYFTLKLYRLAINDYSKGIAALKVKSPEQKPVKLIHLRANCWEKLKKTSEAIQDYQYYLKIVDPRRKKAIQFAQERIRVLRGH